MGGDGPGSVEASVRRGMRILLVDDSDVFRLLLRELEVFDGHRLGEASTAHDAVRVAGALRPHVVLLDGVLPDGSPRAVAAALRRASPGVRVVLLTGQPTPSLAALRDEGVVDEVLEKGSDLDVLERSLRRVLASASP